MTATVYVIHADRPPTLLNLLPERRKLLIDWLAVQTTGGYTVVPEEVLDTVLDICASPGLSLEERAEYWDGVQTWVDLREGLNARRMLPEAVGCQDQEDAEKTASANAEDAKSLLVHGPNTARGSRSTSTGDESA